LIWDGAIDPVSCRSVSVSREKVPAAGLFCISITRGRPGHLACANGGEFFPWQQCPLSLSLCLSLSHCPSLSINAVIPTSPLLQPAINPTSLYPFASRHFYFLFLWFFPSFSAPCDHGVTSRELNGEAGGCICVQSLNSISTMQTVLACYLHTQRNG